MQKKERAKNRKKLLDSFDENGVFEAGKNIFGLPFTAKNSELVIIPVPWEATVSYREGTSDGPASILESSNQIDLYNETSPKAWKEGIAMEKIPADIRKKSDILRKYARAHFYNLEKRNHSQKSDNNNLEKINKASSEVNSWVESRAKDLLRNGQTAAVLGGEHSVSFGLIRALSEKYPSFGILHIDSHLDLRNAYAGFQFSHASAMRNILDIPQIKKIAHVAVRDYCSQEVEYSKNSKKRSVIFSDRKIKKEKFAGKSWKKISEEIISSLPNLVYVSFDIDGLNPSLCPNTGTPVPGGLEYNEAIHLLEEIILSGRKIIGFDLCEVAPASRNSKAWGSDWNSIVGSRILYELSLLSLRSR